VVSVTEARLVNALTSTSLASRSRVISALGRYNQECGIVENECVWLRNVQISALLKLPISRHLLLLLLEMFKLLLNQTVSLSYLQVFAGLDNILPSWLLSGVMSSHIALPASSAFLRMTKPYLCRILFLLGGKVMLSTL
jgi:hypothetical protein